MLPTRLQYSPVLLCLALSSMFILAAQEAKCWNCPDWSLEGTAQSICWTGLILFESCPSKNLVLNAVWAGQHRITRARPYFTSLSIESRDLPCQMLFLDEPSAAVDAGAKRHLWKVIKSRGPDQQLVTFQNRVKGCRHWMPLVAIYV